MYRTSLELGNSDAKLEISRIDLQNEDDDEEEESESSKNHIIITLIDLNMTGIE